MTNRVLDSMADAELNAPVALPPIHLPRWLVNLLGIGEFAERYASEIVSGILIHHLSASVAEPADETAPTLDSQPEPESARVALSANSVEAASVTSSTVIIITGLYLNPKADPARLAREIAAALSATTVGAEPQAVA